MSKIKLEAKKRDLSIKAKDLLKSSRLPGVVYGPKAENILIDMDYQEFRKTFLQVKKGTIFTLSVEGKDIDVLVKDYDLDDLYDTLTHVDLILVNEKTILKAEIQLIGEGASEAIKLGGVLRQEVGSLKVKCLPKDLASSISFDLTKLENSSSRIRVGDLDINKNIEVMMDKNLIIASVIIPRSVAAAVSDTQDAPKAEAEEAKSE